MATGGKPRAIVTGFVGQFPMGAGGVAWDYLQYVLGLRALGWDALYLEDTREWPAYDDNHGCPANVTYLASVMERFGLKDSWAYRDERSGKVFGLSSAALLEFARGADLFLNVSCATPLREEYASIPVRALLDTDPMFTQLQYLTNKTVDGGVSSMRELIENHTHHLTFGESIGAPDCRVPSLGLEWHATRQPVVLDLWPASSPPNGAGHGYTTVMNWSFPRDLEYNGERWGHKSGEFLKFLALPSRVPEIPLGIALGQAVGATAATAFPARAIYDAGWSVVDANACAADPQTYQEFIVMSRGEFSVAKQTYVKAKTGWFSCRSACYLAAGRPVVTQDTTWSRLIPNGRGLLAFADEESAADALRQVELDPKLHSKAARKIAEDCFDSRVVLREMLAHIGL